MLKDIVIVTRNDTIRGLYDRVFHARGIRAHLFATLEDARAHTRISRPDAVVVDMECSSRAELRICRKMKDGLPTVPMLLIGHEERYEDLTRETGAEGYLRKPFTPDHLVVRIDELHREMIARAAAARARKAAFEEVARDPETHLLNADVFEAGADEIERRVMDALGFMSLASFALRIDRFRELAAAGDGEAGRRILARVSQAIEWWMWRRVDPARTRDIIGRHIGDGRFVALFAMHATSDVMRLTGDIRALMRMTNQSERSGGDTALPPFTVSVLIKSTAMPERVKALVQEAKSGVAPDGINADSNSLLWIDLDQI